MEIYRTSDTPFAAYLLTLGHKCTCKGLNGNNGRIWFGFDIAPLQARRLEDEWNGTQDEDPADELYLCASDCNLMFQLKTNLVRVTKGGVNDPRFTSDTWKSNYLADNE